MPTTATTGNFGQVREAYTAARQTFPQAVIEHIRQDIDNPSPKILDLGCGTGIATRQLAEIEEASVIGCDIDQAMIEEARKASHNITYVVAPANALPFASKEFNTVTSFSAFHWFTDEQSLSEIKRVLKAGGFFFVVHKNDFSGFHKGHKNILGEFLGKNISSPKDNYDPAAILRDAGFSNVTTKTFVTEEEFSPEGALRHIQSTSAWNEVPAEREREATEFIREHISRSMVAGKAVRKLKIVVVGGRINKLHRLNYEVPTRP